MANNDNLKPFKKGHKLAKGRPKKLVSAVIVMLKEEGNEEVTAEHVKQVYTLLIGLTQDRLKSLALDNDVPMLYRIVAKEILGGKGFEIIEKMLDRAHGKATTNANVQVAGAIEMDVTKMSNEQLNELLARSLAKGSDKAQ